MADDERLDPADTVKAFLQEYLARYHQGSVQASTAR